MVSRLDGGSIGLCSLGDNRLCNIEYCEGLKVDKRGVSGALILFIALLFALFPFFDWGIRGTFETFAQPDNVEELNLLCFNMTSVDSDLKNCSKGSSTDFDVGGFKYRVTWDSITNDFSFYTLHWFWNLIVVYYEGYNWFDIHEDKVVELHESGQCGNYTYLIIDKGGGRQQNVFMFIYRNSTTPFFNTMQESINDGNVTVLLGGSIPESETGFLEVGGIIINNYLTGLQSPFTDEDYPAPLSIIYYSLIVMGAIALALYMRG